MIDGSDFSKSKSRQTAGGGRLTDWIFIRLSGARRA